MEETPNMFVMAMMIIPVAVFVIVLVTIAILKIKESLDKLNDSFKGK